jgi:hypothetical protein
VRLTAAELELADWAIDPMGAYWSDVVEDEDEDEPEDLPRTEGNNLIIPTDVRVIGDFLYRVEIHVVDLANKQEPRDTALIRTARSLGRKIREFAASVGFPNVEPRM